MPLTKCEDCDREVSTIARACPGCGRPVLRESDPVAAAICSLILPGAGSVYQGNVLIGIGEFLMVGFFYLLAIGSVGMLLPLAAFVHALVILDAIFATNRR